MNEHQAPDRPSPTVLDAIERACRKYGYSGMNDPALVEFVRRTAGVDHPRFLTRGQASVVLIELIMAGRFNASVFDLATAQP